MGWSLPLADVCLLKWDIDAPGGITRVLETWPAGFWVSSQGTLTHHSRERSCCGLPWAWPQCRTGSSTVPERSWWVKLTEAEHSRRMLPWDQLCWHLWGGRAGSCLLFPAHTQGASCTKWHQGSLFSSDATFVTCYRVNCDKIDWSSPEPDSLCWDGCCEHSRQVQSLTGLLVPAP